MTKIEIHRALGRTIEILVSIFLLLTIFPFIYVVMAVIVKRHSSGPAIVTHKRHCDNGKEYDAFTFRVDNIDSFLARTPQLINLLRGDISIHITVTYDTGEIVSEYIKQPINIDNDVNIEQDFRS